MNTLFALGSDGTVICKLGCNVILEALCSGYSHIKISQKCSHIQNCSAHAGTTN